MRCMILILCLYVSLDSVASAQEDCLPPKITVPKYDDPTEEARFAAISKLQRQVWQTKVTFECHDVRLTAAVKQLSEASGIPLSVDAGFLVQAATPVSVDVKDVSLHSTLVMLLRPHGLAYQVNPERVLITTKHEAERSVIAHFYQTSEILPESGEHDLDNSKVLYALKSSLWEWWESTWSNRNGVTTWSSLHSNRSVMLSKKEGIIVESSPLVHWQIEQLIEKVKEAKNRTNDPYSPTPLMVPEPVADPWEISEQLRTRRITYAKQDATLVEIVAALQEAAGVAICVDTEAVGKTQLTSDKVPLDVNWKERTLSQTLDEFASQFEAGWRIVDDRIELTCIERASATPVTRVYPVRDLVWYGLIVPLELKARLMPIDPGRLQIGGAGKPGPNPLFDPGLPSLPDYRQLESVVDMIAPDGSSGRASLGEFTDADCVVVAASLERHARIELVLAELRKNQNPWEATRFLDYVDNAEAEVISVSYWVKGTQDHQDLSLEQLHQLADQIREQVEPESWNGDESYILVAERQFIVRHRRDVQRKVLEALKPVEALSCEWYDSWRAYYD